MSKVTFSGELVPIPVLTRNNTTGTGKPGIHIVRGYIAYVCGDDGEALRFGVHHKLNMVDGKMTTRRDAWTITELSTGQIVYSGYLATRKRAVKQLPEVAQRVWAHIRSNSRKYYADVDSFERALDEWQSRERQT